MNIYEKLAKVRVELQEENVKKSGVNKFSGYKYYDLADFLPVINKLFYKNKMLSTITFTPNLAILKVINSEDPQEYITFTSPQAEANLKGCYPIQNLGATQTYQRRYLYTTALEIVENDFIDLSTNINDTDDRIEKIKELKKLIKQKGFSENSILEKYKIKSFTEIKDTQINQALEGLKKIGAKK